MTDSELIDAYRRHLSAMRGAAANTVLAYLREIENLQKHLANKKLSLLAASYDHFLTWREEMHRAPRGVALALAAVRSFYNFLDDRSILRPNPFPRDFRVKIKRQEPVDVPTVQQFLQIRANLLQPMRYASVNLLTRQTIVEMLAGSGLRIEALVTLKRRHLRLDEQRPHIVVEARSMACKGNTAGTVPVSPYAAELLREYLKHHAPENTSEPIFPVTKTIIRSILKKIEPPGLHLKPHALRHFFCSMTYYRNFDGGRSDLIWVRDAAGHSSVATTDGYLKLARRIVQTDADWETWALGKPVSVPSGKEVIA